jgi:hypothetical protein
MCGAGLGHVRGHHRVVVQGGHACTATFLALGPGSSGSRIAAVLPGLAVAVLRRAFRWS